MFQNRYESDYDCEPYEEELPIESCRECGCDFDSCNCNCECEIECIVGPTGPMGPKGPQGPRGLQGQQGREGLQGPRGLQGVTGPQGEPGIQGATGAMGPRGINGSTGPAGNTGATGAQGPQGPQGNTGPAGRDAPIAQFASASLQSYTNKEVCSGQALVFDISNIQRGFTVSDDYRSLCASQQGTYVIQYGAMIANNACMGDAIAIELNNKEILEESRMPVVSGNFVYGTIIISLHVNDTIRLIADSSQALAVCSDNDTINAFLVVYQINS